LGLSLVWSARSGTDSGRDGQIIALASQYTSDATALVSTVYRTVQTGLHAEDLRGRFAPAASGAAEELVARYSLGAIDSWTIDSASLLAFADTLPWEDDASPYGATLLVRVDEYAKGSDTPIQYEYRVAYTLRSQGDAASLDGQWLIRSVEPANQPFAQ
jgi:hypothetical protein